MLDVVCCGVLFLFFVMGLYGGLSVELEGGLCWDYWGRYGRGRVE